MAGYDRTQADVIAYQAMQKNLADLATVPALLAKIQSILAAQQQQQGFKKPSVFAGGTIYDFFRSYVQETADLPSLLWSYFSNGGSPGTVGPITVVVLNVEDADVVRLAAMTVVGGSAGAESFPILGYAFAPTDPNAEIPLSDFATVNTVRFFEDLGGTSNLQLSDEIPCAGNRYLHLFWLANSADLMATFLAGSTPGNNDSYLTYALIK